MIVEDGGVPPKSDVATVELEVLRNFNRPVFEHAQYNASVFETYGIGETLTTVRAVDMDEKVK